MTSLQLKEPTALQLRDYQEEDLQKILSYWEQGDKAILWQLPTGTGKTEGAIRLAEHFETTIFVTHKKELHYQTIDRFQKYGFKTADHRETVSRQPQKGKVNFYTVQMRFRPEIDENTLLIIDEVHRSPAKSYVKWISVAKGKILGLSATPWRLSHKQGFDHLFDRLVSNYTTNEMVDRGWLCHYSIITPYSRQVEVVGGRTQGRYGDYIESEINVSVLETDAIVEFWQRFAKQDSKTLWFVPTVEAAIKLEATMTRNGLEAVAVTAETSQSFRDIAYEAFEKGIIRHLINVLIYTEGIDVPDVDIIVMARPTKSLSLWLQCSGRGLRIVEDNPDKVLTILDLGNSIKKEMWAPFDATWSLYPRGKGGFGRPILVECIQGCGAIVHPSHRMCYNCGQAQYYECPGCKRDRRGFMPEEGVCRDCQIVKQQEILAQKRESDIQRYKESVERIQERKAQDIAFDNPYKVARIHSQTPTEQIYASYPTFKPVDDVHNSIPVLERSINIITPENAYKIKQRFSYDAERITIHVYVNNRVQQGTLRYYVDDFQLAVTASDQQLEKACRDVTRYEHYNYDVLSLA